MLGVRAAQINADRARAARELARAAAPWCCSKGAGTAVAAPDGELIVNPTGGPALASGGTGDVLLGIVTGLLAQGRARAARGGARGVPARRGGRPDRGAPRRHGPARERAAARAARGDQRAARRAGAGRRSSASLQLHSPSPDATERLGRALAEAIDAAGAIVLLSGPLGAGKTRFVKGLAAGLGVAPERVQSPTFVVAQELPLPSGRVLVHVDCYRIASEAELESAGLLDWLAPGALVVAEWPERVPGAWPEDRLEISFARGAGENEREIEMSASGPSAAALLARWRTSIGS